MLYLIGLGLDKKDISIKALEAIKKCKRVYLETYTNVLPYSQKDIEKILNVKITPADRKMVEEGTEILEQSKHGAVALLVSGDPLTATTHIELLMRAESMKIKTKVIHAPSIVNAVLDSGLQMYKFGKTASIAKWTSTYKPESFFNIIRENQSIGAHTLVLIDIGLSVSEALGYIETIAKTRNPELLEKKIIVCECLGTDEQKFTYNRLPILLRKKFKLPACIIIPGKLHFIEEEMLNKL